MPCGPDEQSVQLTVTNEGGATSTVTVTFNGVTYEGNTSTFCYIVNVAGTLDLSHWVIGTCPDPLPTVLAVTRDGVLLGEDDWDLNTDPVTGVTGLKFDDGVLAGTQAQYCVTFAGRYVEAPQDVGIAAGGDTDTADNALCGPSCALLQNEGCVTCGDCLAIDLSIITAPGQGVWCKNVVAIKEPNVDITGVGTFYIEQKLPFELLIIRQGTVDLGG